MKRKPKGSRKSLIAILTRSYISFILVALLAVLGLLFLVSQVNSDYTAVHKGPDVTAYTSLLTQEDYRQIDAAELTGQSGYFSIITADDGQQIYTSDAAKSRDYTGEELRVMSDSSNSSLPPLIVDSHPLIREAAEAGEIQLNPSMTLLSKKDGSQNYLLRWAVSATAPSLELGTDLDFSYYLLVTETGQVLSSNIPGAPDRFSQKALEVLLAYSFFSGRTPRSGYFLYQHPFVTVKGEERLLIVAESSTDYKSALDFLQVANLLIFLLVIAFFSAAAFFFAYRMRRQVQGPIEQLEEGLNRLTAAENTEPLDYQGPREFLPIVATFNRVSADLRASEQRQQELQAEKQKMLADISHDLKTPITVIQGYSKAVNDNLVPESERDSYLRTISQKAEQLTELINTFHNYSLVDHPDFSLNREETNLAEFLRNYAAEHYAEFDIGGYQLAVEIPEEKLLYFLDKAQFTRVLDNLFANFFKYNPPGTTLWLSLEAQPSALVLTLADDGLGIAEDIAEQLFQPFVTGDSARSGQFGSGLGLAIVQRIIAEHGGTIQLLQPPPSPYKTAFVLEFPLRAEE